MIPPLQPDPARASLRFAEEALRAFGFLETEYGFHRVQCEITFVRFESHDMFINVYHGRSSFEFGVEFGTLGGEAPAGESPFVLEELLDALGKDTRLRYQAGTTREVVRLALEERARLVHELADFILNKSHLPVEALLAGRKRFRENLETEVLLHHVRGDVESAWRAKDFRSVVQLYEQIRGHLTPAEAKKLEYAKKHVS